MSFLLPELIPRKSDKELGTSTCTNTDVIVQNTANKIVLQQIFGEINQKSSIFFSQYEDFIQINVCLFFY